LDDFLASHDAIREDWEATFVVVKVNFSPRNQNEKVLGRYPKISGYPHFLVLGPDGKFLDSQRTGPLEKGKSYNRKAFQSFIEKWKKRMPAK
jgi:hypothetical protein